MNQICYRHICHHMQLEYHNLMAQVSEARGNDNMANITIDMKLLRCSVQAMVEKGGASDLSA